MSSGTCPGCGKEFKNIGVHMRYCKNKAMNQEAISKNSIQPIQNLDEPITSIKPQISIETRDYTSIDMKLSNIKNMLYFNIFLNFMTLLTFIVVIILAE